MAPVLTIVAGFGRGDFRSSRLKIAKSQLLSFFDLLSPGGMRLRRVRCVVGHLHRRQGAGSPQVCQHQSCLNLFGTRVASNFSAPTQVNLFGTGPSSRFSVIFTALRFSSSLLPNQQQIFEVSET